MPWPDGLTGALLLAGVLLVLVAARPDPARAGAAARRAGGAGAGAGADARRPAGLAASGLDGGGLRRRAGRRARAGDRRAGLGGARRRRAPRTARSTPASTGSGCAGIALVLVSHLHADHIGGIGRGAARPAGRRGRGRAGPRARGGRCARSPARRPRPARRSSSWCAGRTADLARAARSTCSARCTRRRGVDPDDGTAVNDGSLVLRARTPAGTVLLTGDVELAAQADLLGVRRGPARRRAEDAAPRVAATASRAFLDAVAAAGGAGQRRGRATRYRHPNAGAAGAARRRRASGARAPTRPATSPSSRHRTPTGTAVPISPWSPAATRCPAPRRSGGGR